MQPIDKFTNIDAVYFLSDSTEEDNILEYVWDFAIQIHATEPKYDGGFEIEGSEAMPKFKRRYNKQQIRIPLTYKEYKNNLDIQEAISALHLDVDKFWYAILFIWDYVDGQCQPTYELNDTPRNEINKLLQLIAQYEVNPEANHLTDHITFKEDLSLSLQVNGKTIHAIETANAIKFIISCCQKHSADLELKDISLDREHLYDNIEMISVYPSKKETNASNSKRICLFAKTFKLFFALMSPLATNYRSEKRNASNVTFLISQLIYLTGISDNENFMTDKTTLKGYLSKYKNLEWNVTNQYYL